MNAPIPTGELASLSRESAFEVLYEQQHAFVWRCARRLCLDEAEVDDVVQDVFVIAYRRLDQLDPDIAASTWLFGILHNVMRNRARSRGRHRRRILALAGAVEAGERQRQRIETEIGERVLAGRLLHGFLRELDPKVREVFVLAELEGHTAKEIAAAMGINPNTASSRLRLARRAFCDHFGIQRSRAAVHDATRELREQPCAPSGEVRARSWAMVLAAVARPAWWSGPIGGLMVSLSSKTGVALAGVAVSVALAVGAWGQLEQAAPSEQSTAANTIAVSGVDARASAKPRGSQALSASAPEPAPVVAIEDADDADGELDGSVPVLAQAGPARSATRSKPELGGSIAAEQLRLARAALVDDQPAQALALLDRVPARELELLDARVATRVAALCKLGAHDQARASFDALQARTPTSSVLARIDHACW